MKKPFVFLGLVITAVVLAVPLAGCSGEVSFTTANLSDVHMATSVDQDTMAPIETTTTYTPESPIFYCTVRLANAPDDTEIKAEWIFLEGELDVTDYVIYEDMITTGGEGYVVFSLQADTLWPRGDYRVILYVDDKESQSIDFTVE